MWREQGARSPYFKECFGDWEVKSNQPGADANGRFDGLRANDNISNGKSDDGLVERGRNSQGINQHGDSVHGTVEATQNRGGAKGVSKTAPIISGVGLLSAEGKPAIFYHGIIDEFQIFGTNHPSRKEPLPSLGAWIEIRLVAVAEELVDAVWIYKEKSPM
jgi:hypothetical protein